MTVALPIGLVPERTDDPREALRLLEMDGAAILETGTTEPADAEAAAAAVLGDRLRRHRPPIGIRTNPVLGRGTHPDAERKNVLSDSSVALDIHVDGYLQYGTVYPDYVFLLCAEPAERGGESFLLDGQRLLTAIAGDPDERDLWDFIWRTTIEHTTPTGVPHQCPIAVRTRGGRVTLRFNEHQRPLTPDAAVMSHLRRWSSLAYAAAADAPRFLLVPGQFLCVDNYRIFHGRDPYAGNRRLLHRVWAWSDAAIGIPADV